MNSSTSIAYIHSEKASRFADLLPKNQYRSSLCFQLIDSYQLFNQIHLFNPTKATREDLLEYHSSDYVDFLLKYSYGKQDEIGQEEMEEYGLTEDCFAFDGITEYILWVAGGSLTAARTLMKNQFDVVINVDGGRHHSLKDEAKGFCYVNDIVLALTLLREKFERILYLDIDIHHGDAVESAFSHSNKVTTVSFHQYLPGFFPGTGSIKDIGFGKGMYHTINVPLLPGLSGETFQKVYNSVLTELMDNNNFDCIVMQCGMDGLAKDPLGGWNLGIRDISNAIHTTVQYNLPTLLLGGGGYNNANVARCWAYTLSELVNQTPDNNIPEHAEWLAYSPDFVLHVPISRVKDENVDEYIQEVLNEIVENIRKMNN
ncbi:histone deacetylase 8 [Globomyces pollinis-pini]|nr:histone deacetylase 8 [Globomyces pollinis-pini]